MIKKVVFHLTIVLLAGVILVCGWMLWGIFHEYNAAADTYAELTQYVSVPAEHASAEPEEREEKEINWPVVDFEALTEICPDIVGWIYIEGTAVNYPVVQGDDNSYYLKRLIDGTANNSGSIFLDYAAVPDFSAQNSVIYGHNMKDGSMFRTLISYNEQEFYEEHPTALLVTPEQNYEILLFSGYVADPDESAWDMFFTGNAYGLWLEEIAGKSCFVSGITPDAEDRIVTLSTCSYEFHNARFVLHGILQ